MRRLLTGGLVALVFFAVFAVGAGARERVVTLRGFDAPGPARYDTVKVLQIGPASARHVLVLEPGTSAGAPYFQVIARDLVARLPGWQVWSVERRENRLEDHSVLDRALRARASAQDVFDYYLGWLGNPSPGAHFEPVASAPFAKRWGMRVAMQDLHRVVRAARRGGRTVVLGGHSLGGNLTAAYATWDFRGGRPGARDLAGLVFIDGSGGSSRGRGGSSRGALPTAAEARETLAALDAPGASPFLDLGFGPWEAGVFNAVGSTAARIAPRAPAVLGAWTLLPAVFRTPTPPTNRGGYGYALDASTSPASLALAHMHIGHLAKASTPGDPAGGGPAGGGPAQGSSPVDWVDGELGTVARAARLFSGRIGMDGTSWYHPVRLSDDARSVNNGIANPAQRVFGVRAIHGRSVRLPMYAFETSLGAGRVLRSVRALARQSGVPRRDLVLVDRHRTYAHIDPLVAVPRRNAFLKTVVPFLRRVG
jgi:hypothetical protein